MQHRASLAASPYTAGMDANHDNAPQRPRGRGIYLLPNLFTTAALFSGFFAIIAASQQRFEAACIAIFIAAILDGLDGRVAGWAATRPARSMAGPTNMRNGRRARDCRRGSSACVKSSLAREPPS